MFDFSAETGFVALFFASFVAATVLPGGSEFVLIAVIHKHPEAIGQAVLVATAGNTLGGMVTWWMGLGAHKAVDKWRDSPTHLRALHWLEKMGPRACLLSWLPGVGDPLCAVAGWLQMPLWPCTFYMAIGKFLRYLAMTSALLWVF